MKIQEADYSQGDDLVVIEYYLHYEDVVSDKIESMSPREENLSTNKLVYAIYPKQVMPSNSLSKTSWRKGGKEENITLPFTNDTEYKKFIAKIKEKAFDLALLLDDAPARFSIEPETISADAESDSNSSSNDGAEKETTSSNSSSSSSNNSSSNSSSNNSTPKAKTRVYVTLQNKSNEKFDVSYKPDMNGVGFSVSSRGTRGDTFDVGQKLYRLNSKVPFLTITGEMDKQTIQIQ